MSSESIAHRADPKNPDLANVVDAVTTGGIDLEKRGWQRNFVSSSSCGLCGKLTIESVRLQVPSVRDDKLSVPPALLRTLPDKMRAEQVGFDETGGIHAAGLFDRKGNLLIVREDIGRHNAVDKIVGTALLAGDAPLRGHVLMVSGRASFEIVQKALIARIPLVAAVSAASSLAVELADSCRHGPRRLSPRRLFERVRRQRPDKGLTPNRSDAIACARHHPVFLAIRLNARCSREHRDLREWLRRG